MEKQGPNKNCSFVFIFSDFKNIHSFCKDNGTFPLNKLKKKSFVSPTLHPQSPKMSCPSSSVFYSRSQFWHCSFPVAVPVPPPHTQSSKSVDSGRLKEIFSLSFISIDEILAGRKDGNFNYFYFVAPRKESLGKEEVIHIWKIRK